MIGVDRETLDLNDSDAIATMISSGEWAAVINAAAYTAVDRAEEEIVSAWAINALAPAALANACRLAGVPIIQISTDYVFDGSDVGERAVNDPTAPLGVYGASKRGGELAVATSGARHAIIRTSWLVSAHGSNFVRTMLRLATTTDTLRVVADQWGSPTNADDLAAALGQIVMRFVEHPETPSGIWHFSNSGATNWADFAAEIFAQSSARGGPSAVVTPVATGDYPTAARRPVNALLGHSAIVRDFGIVPRSWHAALSDILDDLIGEPR